jgi:hypothetical protein
VLFPLKIERRVTRWLLEHAAHRTTAKTKNNNNVAAAERKLFLTFVNRHDSLGPVRTWMKSASKHSPYR